MKQRSSLCLQWCLWATTGSLLWAYVRPVQWHNTHGILLTLPTQILQHGAINKKRTVLLSVSHPILNTNRWQMVFIMSTRHPSQYEWTAVQRVRDIGAEFVTDMQGFGQLRLQNMGQRACHDTPFLCLFHYNKHLKTAIEGPRFLFVFINGREHVFICWAQLLPLWRSPSPDYLISTARATYTGHIVLILASHTLDLDSHCSLFRPCVSTLTSQKNTELMLPCLALAIATRVPTDR